MVKTHKTPFQNFMIKTKEVKSEALSKHQTKLLEEMFMNRDWCNEPTMWDEAQQEVDREIKLSIGYPIY